MTTYRGSCECERVKFEATFNLLAGTFKCNCRICTKSRFWGVVVAPENVKVIEGESELSKYWTGPVHHFCKHCGVKLFGLGEGEDGKKMAAVALSTLDDLDPRELARAQVHYFDGKHDRFDRAPEFTGHL